LIFLAGGNLVKLFRIVIMYVVIPEIYRFRSPEHTVGEPAF